MGTRMFNQAEVAELRAKWKKLEEELRERLIDELTAAVTAIPVPRDPAEVERVTSAITERLTDQFERELMASIPPELH
jgi:hypothetical protein